MGGPSYHPEKAVGRSYPKPKKGSRVTCLACKHGKVLIARTKVKDVKSIKTSDKFVTVDCTSCKGKGYIIAK